MVHHLAPAGVAGFVLANGSMSSSQSDIASDPDLSGVEVFPEIAALVVGYARLRRRREGLHVMVNVGPSTIDVCGFGLRDHDGDDRYSLYTVLVERIGIRESHRQRMPSWGRRLHPEQPPLQQRPHVTTSVGRSPSRKRRLPARGR